MKLVKPRTMVLCLLLSVNAFSQPVSRTSSSVYIKVYGAYGFLAPGSTKGIPVLPTEPVRFNVVKQGMGGGARVGIGGGVILNDLLNLGVDVEYFKGIKMVNKENITAAESKAFNASGYSLEAERGLSYGVVSIIPNIVFKAMSTSTYYIYNRLGVVIGLPLKMNEKYYQHYHYHNDSAADHTIEDRDIVVNYTGKHTLKMSIGYQITIGIQTSISEKLKGFAEFSAYNISFNRDGYEDMERLTVTVEKNKAENPLPTVYDHSRFINRYTSNGATGSVARGVPYNQTTITTYAQQPVIMNALTFGAGLAYRF